MADERDTRLGQMAIQKGFATASQVKDALGLQEESRAATGRTQQLGHLMLERGIIDRGQLQELLTSQARKTSRDIGGYTLISRLGAGGMGAVYKARQESMDRMVALKVLPPKLARDATFIERFFREARAVARLNHANIVQGIDVGESSGYYYFAMEFVEGSSLRDVLEERGTIPEQEALNIVAQITRGLKHAHAHDLVHRDIKPDNVLIDMGGVAKLCDLGLARQANEDSSLTQTGVAMGTPHYISPEQARGETVDARTDLYSLGATWFHLLTGRPPYTAENALAVITKHLADPVPRVSTVRRNISSGTEAVIAKLMSKEPKDRHQSADELLEDISDLEQGRPPRLATAGTPLGTAPTTARVRDTRLRAPVSARLNSPDLPDGISLDDADAKPSPPAAISRRPVQVALAIAVLALAALGTWGIRNALSEPAPSPPSGPGTNTPASPPKDEQPTQVPAQNRLAELEAMHKHILSTREKDPSDLTLLEKRWRMLRDAGAKTKYALIADDELRKIADQRQKLAREEDLKKLERFSKLSTSVDELLSKREFADAIKACETFAADPAMNSRTVRQRLATLKKKVNGSCDTAVAAVVARARTSTRKKDFAQARKALAEITAFGIPRTLASRDQEAVKVDAAERAETRRLQDRARKNCRDVLAGIAPKVKTRDFDGAIEALTVAEKGLDKAAADELVKPEKLLLSSAREFIRFCRKRAENPPSDVRITYQGMKFRITSFKDSVLDIRRARISTSLKFKDLTVQQLLELAGRQKATSVLPADALSTGCFLALSTDFAAAKPYLDRARSRGALPAHQERALALRERGQLEVLAEERFKALEAAHTGKRWKECVALSDALLGSLAKAKYVKPRLVRIREIQARAQDAISPLVRYTVCLRQGLEISQLGVPSYSGAADTFLCGNGEDKYPSGKLDTLKVFNNGRQAPLYRFDLSVLPQGARIEKAVLELSCLRLDYGFNAEKSLAFVYTMKTQWSEHQATWNFTSKARQLRWSAPGARSDFDATTDWGLGPNGRVAGFKVKPGATSSCDITPLVKAWVSGARKNCGIYVKSKDRGICFLASKEAPAHKRPKLTIAFKSKRIKQAPLFAFMPRNPTVFSLQDKEQLAAFQNRFKIHRFSTRPDQKSPIGVRAGNLELDVVTGDVLIIWTPNTQYGKKRSVCFTVDCSGKARKDRGHIAFGFSLGDASGFARPTLLCRADAGSKTVTSQLFNNVLSWQRAKPMASGEKIKPRGELFGTYHLRLSWQSNTLAWFLNGRRAGLVRLPDRSAKRLSSAHLTLIVGIMPGGAENSAKLKIGRIAYGQAYSRDFETKGAIPMAVEPPHNPRRPMLPGPRRPREGRDRDAARPLEGL